MINKQMKIAKLFSFFLFIFILSLINGCATLPSVSEKIDDAPAAGEPRRIESSKGLLSPEKSKIIMERLKQSVNPTDILERYTAVIESVTESPLTKGNKVTLLIDGPATYAAMFEAIRAPKTISTLKHSFSKMMKSGKNLPICCCKNRPKVFKSTSFTTVWEVLQPPNLFSNACGIGEFM